MPERLEFGQLTRRNKHIYTEEPLGFLRDGINALIKKTIEEDNVESRKYWRETKDQKREATKRIFGSIEDDPLNASPYSISICVRRFGYEALGIPEAPIEAEALMGMMLGTGGHKELQAKLARKIFAEPEKRLLDKETGISGRADLFFEHPITKRGVVLDFKFVRSWHYEQIKRDGYMSEAVKLTKGVYTPEPSYQLQLDLYMYILAKMGYEMEGGVVVYINRDSGEWKLALEPWDSEAMQRAEDLILKTNKAREIIKQGGQPEDIEPTSQKPSDCKYCPFVYRCREGQEFAGGKSKIERQKRKTTPQQRAIMKKQIEERKTRLRNIGLMTLPLFTDEIFEEDNGNNKEGKNGRESHNGDKPIEDLPQDEPTGAYCDCGNPVVKEYKIKGKVRELWGVCRSCGASRRMNRRSNGKK